MTAYGPVETTCTPDGAGSFTATLRLAWSDGHVERATRTFSEVGEYKLVGDRSAGAFFYVRTSIAGPHCDLGGSAHTLYWPG